jgi:hypothetical protein
MPRDLFYGNIKSRHSLWRDLVLIAAGVAVFFFSRRKE